MSDIRTVKSELELKIEKARVGLSRWMSTGWVARTGLLATPFWYFFLRPAGQLISFETSCGMIMDIMPLGRVQLPCQGFLHR